MNPFLKQIAEVYYKNTEIDISEVCFVFPSRRAGLFFKKYLLEISDRTFFAPKTCTISEFFSSISEYQTEDNLGLLVRLYKSYIEITKRSDNFDKFMSFGETLLRDFNDIDNYLVNAKLLYANIANLKDINFGIDLEKEQIEALERFLGYISNKAIDSKQTEIANVWNKLYDVYTHFKQGLENDKLGFDGMINRKICELEQLNIEFKRVVFVGFNALNECTRKLFKKLDKLGIADFYFDYNSEYINEKDNMANYFAAKNKELFKSRYQLENFIENKDNTNIECIEVPSYSGQAKKVYSILQDQIAEDSKNTDTVSSFNKTAVVLSDESILLPIIYSIPTEVDKINVTMGYSLKFTPVKKLIEELILLQRNIYSNNDSTEFYHKNALSILNHPYIQANNGEDHQKLASHIISSNFIRIDKKVFDDKNLEIYNLIYKAVEVLQVPKYITDILNYILENNELSQIEKEFVEQASNAINRTNGLIQKWNIDFSIDTLIRIIQQVINSISIAFDGEPLGGLQILGMLETRCLDFENIIITSFNEGIFPKSDSSNSYIPYNVRKEFGLPTTEHQDAVYAYNFYRLIQRAKNVYLIYDTRTDNFGSQGEESRFVKQLKYIYKHKNLKTTKISYKTEIQQVKEIAEIQKTPEIMEQIHSFISNVALSASAINTYINCPLLFYYKYISPDKLSEPAEISEEIKHNQFGSIFHYVMENLYHPYKNQLINETIIESLRKDKIQINKLIQYGYLIYVLNVKGDNEEKLQKEAAKRISYKGEFLIVSEVIAKYINYTLLYDKTKCPFTYLYGEGKFGFNKDIHLTVDNTNIMLKGIIDRIDLKQGVVQIIDYKTGSYKKDKISFKLEADLPEVNILDGNIFNGENKDRKKEVFQTLLYAWLYKQQNKDNKYPISTHLYYTIKINTDEFTTEVVPEFTPEIESLFIDGLKQVFSELLNPDIPFRMRDNEDLYEYQDIARLYDL